LSNYRISKYTVIAARYPDDRWNYVALLVSLWSGIDDVPGLLEEVQYCVDSVADELLAEGTTPATNFIEALQAAAAGVPVTFHSPGADEDLLAAATESEAPLEELLVPSALFPAPAPGAFAPLFAPASAPGSAPVEAPGPAAPGPGLDEEAGKGLNGTDVNGGGGTDDGDDSDGDDSDGDAGVDSKQTNSRDGGSSSISQLSAVLFW
jgi:hypothetical protein